MYQEHTLVHDGSAGKRYHIGVIVTLFEYPAHHVQAAVKISPWGMSAGLRMNACMIKAYILWPCVPGYPHQWALLSAKNSQPFLGNDESQTSSLPGCASFPPGEEEHTHAVIRSEPKKNAEWLTGFGEKICGKSVREFQLRHLFCPRRLCQLYVLNVLQSSVRSRLSRAT